MACIALCLSGQLRNVESTYLSSIKQRLFQANEEHEIDVFCHSWYDKTTPGTVYLASHQKDDVPANAPIPENIISRVYDLYDPVSFSLDRQKYFDPKNYNDRKEIHANPQNGLSRLYSIKEVIKLKQQYELFHGFEYDLVVLTRFDIICHRDIVFNSYLKIKGIFEIGNSPHGFSVVFVLGDTRSMNTYATLFDHVDDVWNTGINWCDELLAKRFCQLEEIPIYTMGIGATINR